MPPKKLVNPNTGKPITGQALKDFNARQEATKANLKEAIDKQNAAKAPKKAPAAPKRPDVRTAKPMTGATRKPGDGPRKPDVRNGKPVLKKAAAKPAAPVKAPVAKKPAAKPANKRIVV